MICKEEMINPVLKISPNFIPIWEEFMAEWKGENDLPLYILLGDLARYISELIKKNKISEIKKLFQLIERWHVEGDSYVKEAATIGLLEGLQNTNVVGTGIPEKLEAYLLPESKHWWEKLNDFWEHGKVISD